jgi:putative photosynthetic complex assembly protein 2
MMTLLAHPAVAVLCALFVWWFSTGVVLYIVGRPGWSSRGCLLGAGVLFVASLYGLARSGVDTSVMGAYIAFTCAVLLWGTQEFAFLAGFVTGPRRRACTQGCTGWRRAALAVEAILYHEIALILSGAAVLAVTWSADNQVGAVTFLILWAMRVSAKLNLFLGVPVLNHEFLPERLDYLTSFFTRKPIGLFFPVTVTAATVITTILVTMAIAIDANAFQSTGYTLLASLMALGVLEHWFMVLPLPIAALWSWGMRSRTERVAGPAAASLASDVRVRRAVTKVPEP